MVHPRRLLRPQPAEVQRRRDRRSRSPEVRGRLPGAAAAPRAARPRPDADAAAPDEAPRDVRDLDGLIRQTREPQFISSAYFLRFKFEEGKYALVGRETLDGRDVLRIEYYPARMFGGTDSPPHRQGAVRPTTGRATPKSSV